MKWIQVAWVYTIIITLLKLISDIVIALTALNFYVVFTVLAVIFTSLLKIRPLQDSNYLFAFSVQPRVRPGR